MKKITKTIAKKKAWVAFSKYIRMSYGYQINNETFGTQFVDCYTCGKRGLVKELQTGHAIGGRNNSILFNEDLVRPQCVGCNVFGRGKYAIFTRKLIDELGLQRYDELVTESQKVVQYKINDYLEIAQKYRDKLALIENEN